MFGFWSVVASGVWWLRFLVAVEASFWVGGVLLFAWCALEKTLPPEKRPRLRWIDGPLEYNLAVV
jgi:putative copper export protein